MTIYAFGNSATISSAGSAGESGANGTWTLAACARRGAWEEVLAITADDADNLQDNFKNTKTVFYDVGRRV